ncbi:MAG TPA: zinc ribbon domain-containing protein [Candidatus Methylacidiphilales bacterium]|jgi:uncharacterized membrane protein YvbJ|nr:zinc ribbon domain-containing protein [Candidatus Methylacidiphilales bacterium]
MASKNTFSCPVCGEDVPAKARACPHCGACEKSGWNEEASSADGLDLPEEDFDYEKFTKEEFGTPRKLRGKELLWKVVAGVILVLMIIAFFANFLLR